MGLPEIHFPRGAGQKLFWIDDFLGPAHREQAVEELRFAFWTPSTVHVLTPAGAGRTFASPKRISESTDEYWFTPGLRRMLRGIERRLKALLPRVATHSEAWQATRYKTGGKFDYHFDAGYWRNEAAGERVHTVLIYLDTPRSGGSTHFPRLKIDVKARAGRLLVWRNLTDRGEPDRTMLHSGRPLKAGRKTILVTWIRQRKPQKRNKR